MALDLELIVGAAAVWARASADIATARRRVLVQAMSFEGDAVGFAVAAAIRASPAVDRRVLVDDYTRVNLNDRAVFSRAGRRDAVLQAEARRTWAMFRELIAAGVPVRVTDPIRCLGLNYPARNHKKLILADDAAYIGGVNFSDHNFLWPDLMLRMAGAAAADFLAEDFDATFESRSRLAAVDLGAVELVALDGRTNARGFGALFRRIAGARREIVVVSPYLTPPFTDALAAAGARGVAVRVITPSANNKPIVRDALLSFAARQGLEVRLTPAMTHYKGMLVDSETLILGSSNFDFASLAAEAEFLATIRDPAVIADFRRLVIDPALAASARPPPGPIGSRGRSSERVLRSAATIAAGARLFRRFSVEAD